VVFFPKKISVQQNHRESAISSEGQKKIMFTHGTAQAQRRVSGNVRDSNLALVAIFF
jgi:hypothetical protein